MSSQGQRRCDNRRRVGSVTSNECPGLRCPFSMGKGGNTENHHPCGNAKVLYKDSAKLNEHIKRVHSRKYLCASCSKIFNITTDKDLKSLQQQHALECNRPAQASSKRTRNRVGRAEMTWEQYDRWLKWKEQHVRNMPGELQQHTTWRKIYKCIYPNGDDEQAVAEMLQSVQPSVSSFQPQPVTSSFHDVQGVQNARNAQNDNDILLFPGHQLQYQAEGATAPQTNSSGSINDVIVSATASRTRHTGHGITPQVVRRGEDDGDDQIVQSGSLPYEPFLTILPEPPFSYNDDMMVDSVVGQQSPYLMRPQSQTHTGQSHSYSRRSHSQSAYSHSPSVAFTDTTTMSSTLMQDPFAHNEQMQPFSYLSYPYPPSHTSVSVGGGGDGDDPARFGIPDSPFEARNLGFDGTMVVGIGTHTDQRGIPDESQDDGHFHEWTESGRERL